MDVRLLGPLEVLDDTGRPVELRRQKQRALIAVLALRAGQVVSTDRLLEDLWGERPPRTAIGSLQNLVSHLRRVLGPDVLLTRPPGYLLAVSPEATDVGRFTRLVAAAAELDTRGRAEALVRALALWRGPPLDDLTFEPFAQAEVPRLEELRTAAREQLVEARLALGHHAEAVPELEALVSEQPLRERVRALHMIALYRCGRQADALEAYAATRRFLRDELGLEPSPAMKALQAGMLRQDPALDPAAPEPLAGLPGEERRKTVTVVFVDIVGSTDLGAGLDPEAYRSVLRRFYRAARAVLERHGGTVEKFIGDAVVAVFGIPHQHEDDALRAVRAAVELREGVTELNQELEEAHGVTIRIRLGVNTGEAIAGDPGSGQSFATGYALSVAAKLQQAAGPGGILVGHATYRLVRDAVIAEATEPLALGGRAAPIPAFRVVSLAAGATGVARQLDAPLVGRDDELAALRRAFDEARDADACRVVTVLGDAGVGKTRLANELAAAVRETAIVLVGRCVSYGEGATYLPIAEVVRTLVPGGSEAGIAALLPDEPDARHVARRVRELIGWAEGAPPAGEGFWAVRRLLEAVGRSRPLLLLLEDVHWAEPTLLDLVDHLRGQSSGSPILVLCVARPDLADARPEWPILLALEPLSADESEELIGNLPGGADVPDALRRRIVEIAEGNALFAEQLLAHVLESGEAALDALPGSVEALLASRLDRLPPEERGVLERAAVVGREFWRGAVAELSERDVGAALGTLVARGLVRPAQRSLLAGEEALRFHHVLIRDVAYAGITKERRSALHERVAGWLDKRDAGADEIVGYHLEQAYRYRTELGPAGDDAKRLAQAAGERLGAAGIRAWKRADTSATMNLLGRATALLPDEGLRAELLCELGLALRTAGETEAANKRWNQAAASAARLSHRGVVLRAEIELAHARLYGESDATDDELLDLAAQSIPLFEESADERALARAWLLVSDVHAMRCRNELWRDAAEHARTYYERSGWSPAAALRAIAAALVHGPTPVTDARARCDELLRTTPDRISRANVLTLVARLDAMAGRSDEARHLLVEAKAIYDSLDQPLAVATTWEPSAAEVQRLCGDHGAAEELLRAGCETLQRMHQRAHHATRAAQLAALLVGEGRHDEADRYWQIANANAPRGDVLSQLLSSAVRVRLLAGKGETARADTIGVGALRLAAETDAINQHGDVLLAVAEAKRIAGRFVEATDFLQQAIHLFDLKENRVSAAAARAVLAALEHETRAEPVSGLSA